MAAQLGADNLLSTVFIWRRALSLYLTLNRAKQNIHRPAQTGHITDFTRVTSDNRFNEEDDEAC